jgi:D-sedoheptulose 7-phosphate isomerase
MAFPDRVYPQGGDFLDAYVETYARAAASVSRSAFEAAAQKLTQTIAAGGTIFSCGNGGSAAISNHLLCDFLKGMRTGSGLRPLVSSLSSSIELITAVANDIAYEEVFAFQLQALARPGDTLITISSSGNSPNIIKALDWSRANGVATIAFTGFSGGRAQGLADISLHAAEGNYGVVEDVHQSLMHALAQYIRHGRLTGDVGETVF